MAQMSTPEFQAKLARGPRVQLTVLGPSSSLGRNLALWFVYSLVVSLLAAYVAALPLGADALFTGGAFGWVWP
jgi:hypothetical protein